MIGLNHVLYLLSLGIVAKCSLEFHHLIAEKRAHTEVCMLFGMGFSVLLQRFTSLSHEVPWYDHWVFQGILIEGRLDDDLSTSILFNIEHKESCSVQSIIDGFFNPFLAYLTSTFHQLDIKMETNRLIFDSNSHFARVLDCSTSSLGSLIVVNGRETELLHFSIRVRVVAVQAVHSCISLFTGPYRLPIEMIHTSLSFFHFASVVWDNKTQNLRITCDIQTLSSSSPLLRSNSTISRSSTHFDDSANLGFWSFMNSLARAQVFPPSTEDEFLVFHNTVTTVPRLRRRITIRNTPDVVSFQQRGHMIRFSLQVIHECCMAVRSVLMAKVTKWVVRQRYPEVAKVLRNSLVTRWMTMSNVGIRNTCRDLGHITNVMDELKGWLVIYSGDGGGGFDSGKSSYLEEYALKSVCSQGRSNPDTLKNMATWATIDSLKPLLLGDPQLLNDEHVAALQMIDEIGTVPFVVDSFYFGIVEAEFATLWKEVYRKWFRVSSKKMLKYVNSRRWDDLRLEVEKFRPPTCFACFITSNRLVGKSLRESQRRRVLSKIPSCTKGVRTTRIIIELETKLRDAEVCGLKDFLSEVLQVFQKLHWNSSRLLDSLRNELSHHRFVFPATFSDILELIDSNSDM